MAATEALNIRIGELDNKVLHQSQQLEELREELRTAQAVRHAPRRGARQSGSTWLPAYMLAIISHIIL